MRTWTRFAVATLFLPALRAVSGEVHANGEIKAFEPMPRVPLPAGIETGFTSDGGDLVGRIAEILGKAEKEILISAYAVTDLRVLQALRDARHRGVVVVALLDKSPNFAHYDSPAFLRHAGIPVVMARRGPQNTGWHNQRYLLIDREALVLSSCDLTATASRNAENLLVLRQPAVVARYYNCWLDEAADGERMP